ncbi:MAG TPA: AAA family ATPase, partial [Methanomassiliicoccales archaeon]|nr:AAA family ATPase [Methanomassiliicoccales archaeon]
MYDQELVECSSTDILKPNEEIIGQERAQKALRFGLEIQEKGFNVYVAGMPGTGRKTAVRNYLYELASTKPKGDDWVYVNNFSNPYEPIAIRVPPGMGIQLKADMAAFIEEARRALPRAFESEDYEAKRQDALRKLATERGEIIDRANESAAKQGFSIQVGPTGLMIIPVIDNKPISPEAFEALPKETKESIMKKRESLDADLRAEFRRIREIDVRGMEI